MKTGLRFAIVLIAFYAYSTPSISQNVYRCGSNYSQTPCPDGTALNVSDPRTDEQKKASDARVKQQLDTANRIEATRIQEEKRIAAAQNKAAAAQAKAQAKEDAARAKAQAKQAREQAVQAKKARDSLRKSAKKAGSPGKTVLKTPSK